jgi:hypothetical protein
MGHLWTRLNSDETIRYRQRLYTGLYAYGLNFGQVQDGQTTKEVDIWIYHSYPSPMWGVVYWVEPTFIQPYGGDFSPRTDHAEILADGDNDIGFAIEEDPAAVVPFANPIRPKAGFMDSFDNARLLPASGMRVTNPQPESMPQFPQDGMIGNSGHIEAGDACRLRIRVDVGAVGVHRLGRRMLGLRFAYQWSPLS